MDKYDWGMFGLAMFGMLMIGLAYTTYFFEIIDVMQMFLSAIITAVIVFGMMYVIGGMRSAAYEGEME